MSESSSVAVPDSVPANLRDAYAQYMAREVRAEFRDELAAAAKRGDADELRAALGEPLQFGTAGLRGRMGPGTSRMSALSVLQAAQGVVAHAVAEAGSAAHASIVVGRDARHHSALFARLTAAAAVARGVRVRWLRGTVPTPLVPFWVRQSGATCGVVVTASHNPAHDNGFKVYWSAGCQIVAPRDRAIAALIREHAAPWSGAYDALERIETHALVSDERDAAAAAYKSAVARLTTHRAANQARGARHAIVYTAMHGVGRPFVADAFDAFGLAPFVPVDAQVEPDPDFPTVRFPNPEEGAGALKLAFRTAERAKARLVLANDPDADRLAVAERRETYDAKPAIDGESDADDDARTAAWRIFTGNEIGILLATYCWSELLANEPDLADRERVLVINTTVSSKMLKAFADAEGLRYEETLTGFKWIGSVALRLIAEEKCRFLFGFEEAIGNMIGDMCFDKDGVRSAAVFGEMALRLYDDGGSVASRLHALGDKYGHFVQRNSYFFCYEPATMAKIFERLRKDGKYHDAVGEYKIKHVRDLTTGYDSQQPDNKAILPVSKSSHMITYYFENGAVCTLRGSGTEPKLKYYIEMQGKNADEARQTLDDLTEKLLDEMLQPKENSLKAQGE